jgi:hypothetical protein
MRPVTMTEQLLRCNQCQYYACRRHTDYLVSQRQPDAVIFECPDFTPVPCVVLSEELHEAIATEDEKLTCSECVHCVGMLDWDHPFCGEGHEFTWDDHCSQFTIRENELGSFGLIDKEAPYDHDVGA